MTGSRGVLSFLALAASDMTIVSIHSVYWIYSFIHQSQPSSGGRCFGQFSARSTHYDERSHA